MVKTELHDIVIVSLLTLALVALGDMLLGRDYLIKHWCGCTQIACAVLLNVNSTFLFFTVLIPLYT